MMHSPSLSRQPRGRTTPNPGFTKKHNLLIERRFRKAKSVLELLCVEQQRVWLRCDGQVDRGGDSVCFVLVRLAHVDEEEGGGGGFEDGEDLMRWS